MKDFRNEWFFKQWYSPEELEQLWTWVQSSDNILEVKYHKGKWSGFHPLDTDLTIGISEQATEASCRQWIERLGFKAQEKQP